MGKAKKKNVKPSTGPKWSIESMTYAVEEVKNGSLSLRKAGVKYGIPKTTLELKVKGWKGRSSTFNSRGKGGAPKTIPVEDEAKLANFLQVMSKWGFGLGKNEVLDVVRDYVVENNIWNHFKNNRPGRNWFTSFCERYQLSLKKPEVVESSRSRQASDPFIVYNFYAQLKSILSELGLYKKPEAIFNSDESGFRGDPTMAKIVAKKGQPAKRVTAGNGRKTTTVLATVNASGQKLPPLILHKGKNLWDNMLGKTAYPGTSYAMSENGWMPEKVFKNWFLHQFLPNLKVKPALLIYDGHLSHISVELIEAAIENKVTILKLPPHTSHILQPLDVSVFKGVKSNWETYLADWARKNYGKSLPKSEFANILGSVWASVKCETIKKGFEKCGIYPFDDSKIDGKNFDPEKLSRYKESVNEKTSESTPSPPILSASIPAPHPAIESPASVSPAISAPALVLVQEPTPGSGTEMTLGQNSIGIGMSVNTPIKTYEALLLNTVRSNTPSGEPFKKKRRIDESEIITQEGYLKKLKENAEKKKEIEEKKAQKRVNKGQAKVLQKNKKPRKSSEENIPPK